MSRRGLITSGVSLAIASATLAQSRGVAKGVAGAPGGAAIPAPNATAAYHLAQIGAGVDAALLINRIPLLAVTPIINGQHQIGVMSVNAAIDILENLMVAGLPATGAPFLSAYVNDEATTRNVAIAMAPLGQPILDLLVQLGIQTNEILTAIGYTWIPSVMNSGDVAGGLANLNPSQITAMRATALALVQNSPQECAVLVAGAALGALAALAIPYPALVNTALGAGIVGFPTLGVAASLLP